MGALSYLEHRRSLRPSSLLTLYLLAAAPLNAARARTLWHMPSSDGVVISFTVTVVLMVIALGLELAPKDALMKKETTEKPSREERRGIVERSLLLWFIPTFVHGFRNKFSSATLPSVDPTLTTCRLKETAITGLNPPNHLSNRAKRQADCSSQTLTNRCCTTLSNSTGKICSVR